MFLRLDELVDDSDPDVDMPNSIHDFMTAERLREVRFSQFYHDK